MRSLPARLALIVIIPTVLFFSHCKREETSTPPKSAEAPVTSQPEPKSPDALSPVQGEGSIGLLRDHGRIPNSKAEWGASSCSSRREPMQGIAGVDVFHPVEQKSLASGYGNQTVDVAGWHL